MKLSRWVPHVNISALQRGAQLVNKFSTVSTQQPKSSVIHIMIIGIGTLK